VSKYTLNARNLKSNLTQQILDLIPEEDKDSHNQAMNTWWYNIRKTGGFRLTNKGYEIFKDTLELDTWSVDISSDKKINQKILLDLDRNLDWPYYVDRKNNKIHFFSSKEATLATLYGDVHEWLSKIT